MNSAVAMLSDHTLSQGRVAADAVPSELLPGPRSVASAAWDARANEPKGTHDTGLHDELASSPGVARVTQDFLTGGACATLLLIAAGALLWRSCATRDGWTAAGAWSLFSASVASFTYARVTSLRRLEAFLTQHGVPRGSVRQQARALLAATLPK